MTEAISSSRREFLRRAAIAAGVAMWTPAWRVFASDASAPATTPPDFPSGVPLFQQAFENWAKEIVVDDVWTCTPATAADVVRVTNWAVTHGYTLRARGAMHGWSPLAISPASPTASVVMVDTTALDSISFGTRNGAPTVTVGAGALLQDVMATMETRGYGFTATPAPGDITIGGALAIDAHGAAIPAVGEHRLAGQTYGSLSNLVTSLTVVAWDEGAGAYGLRTIDRSHPHAKSVLTHLARAFVVEATLQVAPNARLRCVSRVDIPATTLFAAPGTSGPTFASFVDKAGRAEAIGYAFTDKPWL
jgi:FAD/FMN-containing dehydrogenase